MPTALSKTLRLAIVLLVVISACPSGAFENALEVIRPSGKADECSLVDIDPDSHPTALSASETRPVIKRVQLFVDHRKAPLALRAALRAFGSIFIEAHGARFLEALLSGGNRAPPVLV